MDKKPWYKSKTIQAQIVLALLAVSGLAETLIRHFGGDNPGGSLAVALLLIAVFNAALRKVTKEGIYFRKQTDAS